MNDKKLVPAIRFRGFTDAWGQQKVSEYFDYERPDKYLVHSDKYLESGRFPVLTANKSFILGYTNETSPCLEPCIIFDDFTTEFRYVDFPFMAKSSAIKILHSQGSRSLISGYYLLKSLKLTPFGHVRHYIAFVQDLSLQTPSSKELEAITRLAFWLERSIALRQRELDKLKELKKSLLERMFPSEG